MASLHEIISWRITAPVALCLALAGCGSSAEVVDTTIDADPTSAALVESAAHYVATPTAEENGEADVAVASAFTPAQEDLVARYRDINSNCRGGSGDAGKTWHQCALRDAMAGQMRRAELCYGKRNDSSEAEKEWHICDSRSIDYADKGRDVPVGRCRISAAGEQILDGPCQYRLQDRGSFWVLSTDHKIFASVDRYSAPAQALVDVDGRTLPNGGDYGDVSRTGGCWSNADVEICVFN